MTAPLVLSDSSDRSCFPPPLLFSGTGCVEKCRGSPSLQGIPRDATRLASDPPPGPGIGDGKVQGGAGPLPSAPSAGTTGSTRAGLPVTIGRQATSSRRWVAACSPSAVKRRTSISARARSETTLDTVPPSIFPMLILPPAGALFLRSRASGVTPAASSPRILVGKPRFQIYDCYFSFRT